MAKETVKGSALDQFKQIVADVSETHLPFAMEMRLQFSAAIVQLIRLRQLTQEKLAILADVPPSFISEIVHADENCTIDTIAKVFHALGARGRLSMVLMEHPTTIEEGTDGTQAQWLDQGEGTQGGEVPIAAKDGTSALVRPVGPTPRVVRLDAPHSAPRRAGGHADIRGYVPGRAGVHGSGAALHLD